MAEVFACAQRSSGNKFYGYGQRMSVTEKKSPSAFTTQPKEYIEYVPAMYRKKIQSMHRMRGAAGGCVQ